MLVRQRVEVVAPTGFRDMVATGVKCCSVVCRPPDYALWWRPGYGVVVFVAVLRCWFVPTSSVVAVMSCCRPKGCEFVVVPPPGLFAPPALTRQTFRSAPKALRVVRNPGGVARGLVASPSRFFAVPLGPVLREVSSCVIHSGATRHALVWYTRRYAARE